jgi:hypothetical protein
MTLVLSPELQSRLVRAAQAEGLTPESYAEKLLREVLPNVPTDEQPRKPRKAGSAKGLLVVPDDFDEPLEDFKGYM